MAYIIFLLDNASLECVNLFTMFVQLTLLVQPELIHSSIHPFILDKINFPGAIQAGHRLGTKDTEIKDRGPLARSTVMGVGGWNGKELVLRVPHHKAQCLALT